MFGKADEEVPKLDLPEFSRFYSIAGGCKTRYAHSAEVGEDLAPGSLAVWELVQSVFMGRPAPSAHGVLPARGSTPRGDLKVAD